LHHPICEHHFENLSKCILLANKQIIEWLKQYSLSVMLILKKFGKKVIFILKGMAAVLINNKMPNLLSKTKIILIHFYRKSHCYNKDIKAIAIDSSGLKCFGHEEWVLEKYKIQEKKAYKKLHIAVDNHHIIQNIDLTNSHVQDQTVVKKLIHPVEGKIKQVTADGAYDNNPPYKTITNKFPSADIVIPPQKGAYDNKANEFFRNRNILEIKFYGHMEWQKRRDYGKRNNSELAVQRYKRILGNKLHARDFERQKQEAIIGCSILNKMMCITLEQIRPKF
jgi:hypothetical protein